MEKARGAPVDRSPRPAARSKCLEASPDSFLFASLLRSCALSLPYFLSAVNMQVEAQVTSAFLLEDGVDACEPQQCPCLSLR